MHSNLRRALLVPALLGSLTSSVAFAGTPTNDIQILFVCDPTLDRVFRLQDYDSNANYNAPGETVKFYDGLTGVIPLTEPTCLTASPSDTVFVGDSTEDIIVELRDGNDDGDAMDAGEANLYFDGRPGGNASNVRLTHVNGVVLRFLTVLWVANSNTTTGEIDSILRLEDLNGDGDANDANEARVFYTPPGGAVGDSVPTAIEIGFDNFIYYTENGNGLARGVWRLADVNHDNVIGPGEATLFFQPPPAVNQPELTSLDVDELANWYVGDRANNLVYRARDVDRNGVVQGIESVVYLTVAPTRSFHDLGVKNEGGVVYVPDAATNTTILYCDDANHSGVIENGLETANGYDDLVSDTNIDDPHGVALDFHTHEGAGDPFCGGDSNMCPCNNLGAPNTGCAHSLGYGAGLKGSDGTDGITNDDLILKAEYLPPGTSALLFAGSTPLAGGFGIPFGDGLRCVGGAVSRIGVRTADGQGFASWGPGMASQQGFVVGQTTYFQVWFRDTAIFCTGDLYNLTNGLQVTFTQ